MSKNPQKLLVPQRDELLEKLISDCDIADFDAAISLISEDDLYIYNLVLRRIKLADNLLREEIRTYVNEGVGLFEEGALRLHLLIGCIEVVSQLFDSSKYLHFGPWLRAKNLSLIHI